MGVKDLELVEHEKLNALDGKNGVVGRFLEWLDEEDISLMTYHEEEAYEGYIPLRMSKTSIIAKHFGIDENALEAEKQALLDEVRNM